MADRGQRGTPEWFGLWENGQLDHGATLASLPYDEMAAADLILAERPGQVCFVPGGRSGTWHIWSGTHHDPDESTQVAVLVNEYAERAGVAIRQFKQLVLQRSRLAVLAADPDASNTTMEKAARQAWDGWGAAEKYHGQLRGTRGRNALISTLATRCPRSEASMADRWPEWLNVGSGTVDLRSALVKPHDPADMITYCVQHLFDPAARGPGWEQLVWHVSGENPNLARYLIKMLGYSLLGDNREQLVFFLTGETASGKSQLVETVREVLGPALAHASSSELIARTANRHPRVEASLAGKRFVTIDESAEQIRVDEGQLKRLTGSSSVSVNRLYRDTETPMPVTWTIWNPTNELPTLTGFDDAIRRRMRAIPCGKTIPEDERETGLAKRLAREEGSAILSSLIWGAWLYLNEGEQCPVEVHLATAEYEAEQNTAQAFHDECCSQVPDNLGGPGGLTKARNSEVWKEYVAWCRETRTRPLGKVAFGNQFRALPGVRYDKVQNWYPGLVILTRYARNSQDQTGWRQES